MQVDTYTLTVRQVGNPKYNSEDLREDLEADLAELMPQWITVKLEHKERSRQ